MNRFVSNIVNSIQLRDGEYKSNNISIIGSSYGGSVALCIKDRDEIKKNITISPVLAFEELTNLDTMSPFLRDVFPGAYRYKEENWQKLINGEILAPRSHLKTVDTNKYYIFGGKLDEEIPSNTLQKFGIDYKIPVKIYSELDHLGLSKIKEQLQKDVISALKS